MTVLDSLTPTGGRTEAPEARLDADLRRARVAADVALLTPETDTRYVLAHRAAMRVAAVVLSVRPLRRRPEVAGRGSAGPSVAAPRDVWSLLAAAAPELTGWAAYFAALQPRRLAVEQGDRSRVTAREADDLARDASSFCTLAEAMVERLGPVSPPPSTSWSATSSPTSALSVVLPGVGRGHR
ncbi:hypothetical protein FHX74_001945 [Friedmanniella endophytica]|uniref:SAV-6107-like HEPN domain-containing protein n=1 Tax=Microlunatus kandeliicorticis TaxID=1759536 RepID=A0A7W3P5T3_9ACTN|nr:SAV_6107 family HEPN domain-containing protein [Microlunatus kandeliicorticis]MBA8794326.1 hypothetical protein [Microlunatus kandeliicorticis]